MDWHWTLSLYTESYWHINCTAELTLHWTLYNTEGANCSERYTYHKTFKIAPDVPHHTAISRHHFTPYALLHHTILHHFTLCSPSRPQTSTSYDIPFHATPYNKYISSILSFKSALKIHLFSSGLRLLCLCAWSCVSLVSCVCIPATFHIVSSVQIAFHTTLNSTPH